MDLRVEPSVNNPVPARLPRWQRLALALIVLLWSAALVYLLLAPALKR